MTADKSARTALQAINVISLPVNQVFALLLAVLRILALAEKFAARVFVKLLNVHQILSVPAEIFVLMDSVKFLIALTTLIVILEVFVVMAVVVRCMRGFLSSPAMEARALLALQLLVVVLLI
jgi:hypothetical protein